MTLCVYALTSDVGSGYRRASVPAPAALGDARAAGTGSRSAGVLATGVAGEPISLITVGRVSAAVGELPKSPKPEPATLARYHATLQELSRELTALLPARFGTCVGGVDELTVLLRGRQSSLRRSLRHVRHRSQMTVRILASQLDGEIDEAIEAPPAGSAAAEPAAAEPRSGSGLAFLRARAAHMRRAREIPGFEPIKQAVRRWVRDERVEKQVGVATVYHLVPRASVAAYERALRSAADAAGIRLVLSGPFPPYAFAGSDVAVGL